MVMNSYRCEFLSLAIYQNFPITLARSVVPFPPSTSRGFFVAGNSAGLIIVDFFVLSLCGPRWRKMMRRRWRPRRSPRNLRSPSDRFFFVN